MSHIIQKGKFKILDNYSPVIGITENELSACFDKLGIDYSSTVIRSPDPSNIEEYYTLHAQILEQLGKSVNIIDSTNARYADARAVSVLQLVQRPGVNHCQYDKGG